MICIQEISASIPGARTF